LLTLIAVLVPLSLADQTGAKIATALINLVIGAVIIGTVDSIAVATRKPRAPRGYGTVAPTGQWTEPPTY
jgi:hypothetical protein